MKTNKILSILALPLAAGSLQGASFSLPGVPLTPDGTSATSVEYTDLRNPSLNNGVALPTGSGSQTVYVVSTFTFGTDTDAHLRFNFNLDAPGDASDRGRIGFEISDQGVTSWANTGNTTLGGTAPGQTHFDFHDGDGNPNNNPANIMSGQTVTILAKFNYDPTNSDTYDVRIGVNPNTGLDTLANVWINPTASSVEGSGTTAGDIFTTWDGQGLKGFKQTVFNQNTPGTAGASSISGTTILTGTDATFANALAVATIPEPSTTALLGLGGLALILRRK